MRKIGLLFLMFLLIVSLAGCDPLDVYDYYVKKVQQRFATFLATFVDLFLIELLWVRGIGIVCSVTGMGIRKLHDCSANSQIKWMVAGVLLLMVLIFA